MDCVFCKIVAGDLPSTKIYENETTVAFLDLHPDSPGHTLVIPKKHSENIYTIEPVSLAAMIHAAKTVSIAIKKGLQSDGIKLVMNNEAAAGQIIFHAHMHVIPQFAERKNGSRELESIATQIKNTIDETL